VIARGHCRWLHEPDKHNGNFPARYGSAEDSDCAASRSFGKDHAM